MRKPSGMIIWIIALLAILAAAYTFYSKSKTQFAVPPPQQSSPLQESTARPALPRQSAAAGKASGENKMMAPDFELQDLNGKSVKLSDYRGKIVILNFWTVWCKYCIQEMPDLNELSAELEKENEAVILAVDVQESPDTVSDYLSANNISLKVLLDEDGTVAAAYGVPGFPTTFVVNGDGSLYTYFSGATDKETLLEVIGKAKKGEPVR